jgi:hypothetical protein
MAQAMYALTSEFFINPFNYVQAMMHVPIGEQNHGRENDKNDNNKNVRDMDILLWLTLYQWEFMRGNQEFASHPSYYSTHHLFLYLLQIFRTCLMRWICRIFLLHFSEQRVLSEADPHMAFESSSTHHGGTERENTHMRSRWGTWTYSGMWSWSRGGWRIHTTEQAEYCSSRLKGICTEGEIVDKFKRRKWSGIALDNFTEEKEEERKWSDDWRRTGKENLFIIASSVILKSLLPSSQFYYHFYSSFLIYFFPETSIPSILPYLFCASCMSPFALSLSLSLSFEGLK